VFNRGTLGSVVSPDGTLWMSLFRACSGWPSGVWIDGDRRTAPDGSSFAWQHWSHTFTYALASAGAAADWRSAGFSAAAEDYNHDLITVVTSADVVDPDPNGQLSVEGARSVTLSALKPVGNPLAAGRPGAPSRSPREVTVRLRETDGEMALARLRLGAGIEAAWRSDLLESTHLPQSKDGELAPAGETSAVRTLTVSDGAALVPMQPFETVTLAVRLASDAGTSQAGGVTGGLPERVLPAPVPPEPVQPVHARYWLHGKGPAPAGNVPVAVHFSPTRVTLGGDAPGARPSGGDEPGRTAAGHTAGSLCLTVACGPAGGAGQVELVVPDGLAVSVTDADGNSGGSGGEAPLGYDLGPNGFTSWDVAVSALPDTAGGRYFLTARIADGLGQVLEDTALITIGEAGGPDPDLPPEELFSRLQSDVTALAGETDLEVLTPAVRLAPGESGELAVRVSSHLGSQLRGEVQLISPVGTWQATGPWTQPVEVSPGGQATVRFAVTVPATAQPGWESWLLVKLMYFGRVRYSEAVALTAI
jgi:alpha-mannosidase